MFLEGARTSFFFQKSSVDLEELLNKNTELCNVLAGLLFDHAIKKYGFFYFI